MKFPLTFTGQLKFQSNTKSVVPKFLKALLVDLELAKSNHVLRSFSIRNNSVRFSAAPISKRFPYNPFWYLLSLSYPHHYRQFVYSMAALSHGELVVEQIEDSISISYLLNFSERFRWSLFIFTGCLLFGLVPLISGTPFAILLIGFCVISIMIWFFFYGLGVAGNILTFRRYLKSCTKQINA
jgi:hypothetical protein